MRRPPRPGRRMARGCPAGLRRMRSKSASTSSNACRACRTRRAAARLAPRAPSASDRNRASRSGSMLNCRLAMSFLHVRTIMHPHALGIPRFAAAQLQTCPAQRRGRRRSAATQSGRTRRAGAVRTRTEGIPGSPRRQAASWPMRRRGASLRSSAPGRGNDSAMPGGAPGVAGERIPFGSSARLRLLPAVAPLPGANFPRRRQRQRAGRTDRQP